MSAEFSSENATSDVSESLCEQSPIVRQIAEVPEELREEDIPINSDTDKDNNRNSAGNSRKIIADITDNVTSKPRFLLGRFDLSSVGVIASMMICVALLCGLFFVPTIYSCLVSKPSHQQHNNVRSTDNLNSQKILSEHKQYDQINAFLAHGGDPNDVYSSINTEHGELALTYAAARGYDRVVTLLLDHGSDANVHDKSIDNATALHMAVFNNQLKTITLLVAHHANVNAIDNDGATVLDYAVYGGKPETVQFLVDHGADVNTKTHSGMNALHYAASAGNPACISILINHGADVNATSFSGATPLHLAAFKGHVEAVQLLLDHGARINCKSYDGNTPLSLASQKKHHAVMKLLQDRGAQ